VPLEDVIWMSNLLQQLSGVQIRGAFRAADYPADQVEGFTSAVQQRIEILNALQKR
jgi:hypothetical protein